MTNCAHDLHFCGQNNSLSRRVTHALLAIGILDRQQALAGVLSQEFNELNRVAKLTHLNGNFRQGRIHTPPSNGMAYNVIGARAWGGIGRCQRL